MMFERSFRVAMSEVSRPGLEQRSINNTQELLWFPAKTFPIS